MYIRNIKRMHTPETERILAEKVFLVSTVYQKLSVNIQLKAQFAPHREDLPLIKIE